MRFFLAALMLAAAPAAAQTAPFAKPAVPDRELATLRGGFTLPGGVQVAIGIAIETRVDGQLALRTAFDGSTVSVVGGDGTLAVSRYANRTVANLSAQGIDIRQMLGSATGTIIANTANDRVIDTTTTVNIDLAGRILPSNFTSTLESAVRNVAGR